MKETIIPDIKDQIRLANRLYYNKEYKKFIEQTTKIYIEHRNNYSSYDDQFKLLEKCLLCIHENETLYTEYYSSILNFLGGLCYYQVDYSTAISFFFLGIMVSKKEQQCGFYNNIAGALAISGKLGLSEKYAAKAIKIAEENQESNHENLNTFKLNYIDFLVKQNKFITARKVFSKLDNTSFDNKEDRLIYKTIELLLDLEESEAYLNRAREIKEKLIKSKRHLVCMDVNEFILIHYKSLTNDAKEVLLMENLGLSTNFANTQIQRKYRVEIIKFYKQTKNEKGEFFHLQELYELDSTEKNENDGMYLSIFFEEFTIFVNQLINKNKVISYQKRELEEITYILSHDLKTPLRTINSFSELIQQKTANKDYNIEEYLDLVISSGKNLYNLVEDVILLHKVEQDKSESKKIDLSNVAAQVIDMFGHNSTYMNGEVVLSGELPTLYGNSSNFYIIFKNIIENGLKYNQSEIPRVSISSKYTRNNVELIFEDNGIGIEPEFHDYIFHYFKRLHTKEKYEGTGFGLGICKKIISKYNGLIKVESAPGKGSKFCVQFPAQMLVEKEMETSYST